MTREDKELLLKDLCARLPYGVIYHRNDGANIELREVDIKNRTLNYTDNIVVRECKPYLRPLSSMTEEEKTELDKAYDTLFKNLESGMSGFNADAEATAFDVDFYNSHHLDYRGLIPMGLALEATEGMYSKN